MQIREITDEIGQKLNIARLVLVAADEPQFAGPVEAHFLRAGQHVPGTIPGTTVAAVEAVAGWPCVGKSGVDMAFAIKPEVLRAPGKGQFATVERRAALAFGDQAGAGLALEFRQHGRLLITVDKSAQDRRLMMCLGYQADQGAVIDRGDPHTPPRSAST
jgi:hypothetical protein